MAQSSVMISLPQMVDLALNGPELGSVNFNLLHALLHVVVQQADITDCNVEFRGQDSERVQTLMQTSKPGPSINLTEYIVTPGKDAGKVVARKKRKIRRKSEEDTRKRSKEEVKVEKEIKVIERRKDSKEDPLVNPPPLADPPELASSSSLQTVIVVEPVENIALSSLPIAVSKINFDNMTEEIDKLKEQMQELVELPGNLGLIEAIRAAGGEKSSPVLDMFQILTLTKRIDAAEEGMNKLASMIEDLAREQANILTMGNNTILDKASEFRQSLEGSRHGSKTALGGDVKEKLEAIQARLAKLEGSSATGSSDDVSHIKSDLKTLMDKVGGLAAVTDQFPPADIIEAIKDIQNIKNRLGGKKTEGDDDGAGDLPPDVRLNELEGRFNEYSEQFNALDTLFNTQVNTLQTQFTDLEREIGGILERINAGLPAGDAGGASEQSIAELYNKIVNLEGEMEDVAATATKLLEDKEERQLHMDALLEQVELLKTIKADREDLEDALADKADTCAVNRKVSHDQFDAACDDLSRGIEETLAKLIQQENLWQQALDDIQRDVGNKLDKMELTPLRDFIHNKLKMLQDRLKALAAMKKEQEAAGTKSKFLKNVNCISCDKEVIMRKEMDPSIMPQPAALPPVKSMGPYLAYELDALRKQQKCAPGRNLNHFENAMAGGKSPRDEDHICNRYCGGSHTVTTPQQRVTRLGHFLNQWGPEIQPFSEGQIRGTDGQMYKATDIGKPPSMAGVASEVSESYYANMKARPSMVVHGDILSDRKKKLEEGDASPDEKRASQDKRPSSEKKLSTSEKRPSGERRASAGDRKASEDRRGSKGSRKGSHRPSTDSATKRPSVTDKSQSKGSLRKSSLKGQEGLPTGSKISFKIPEETAEEAGQPPAEGEVPQGEAPPEEAAAGEEAPPAEEAAQEAAPEAPAEAPPAEEAAPPAE